MKLWSALKLMAVASALCATSVFAAGVLSESASANESGGRCNYFVGYGNEFDNADSRRREGYGVTLKVASLGNGKDLFDYNFQRRGQTVRAPIIIEEDSDIRMKVFVPASKDKLDDYSSYVETGYGHQLEYDAIAEREGTPQKRTLLLTYRDLDGNTATHHVLAYKIGGSWQLISTGSVGNANGIIRNWVHKMSQPVGGNCSL